jgi:hypothetical protein
MDFLQKCFYRVFDLPLPRNAQKRTKIKSQLKNHLGLVGSSKVNQIYVEVRDFVLRAPCAISYQDCC